MRTSAAILTITLLAVVGSIGYVLYAQYSTQIRLYQQLAQLDEVLALDNDDAAHAAQNTLKGLEAEVKKNNNQPHDLALFARAAAFARCADSLVSTLRDCRQEMLPATGNGRPPGSGLPNPGAAVATQLGAGTASYRTLTRQLADYARAQQQLYPANPALLSATDGDKMPVVAALAHLTRLESDVRTMEIATLQHLAPELGARKLQGRIMAVATAGAGSVAPGSTYRARLYLAKVLQGIRVSMACNGQPVHVGPDGQGWVRFRAGRRPGPAVWLGAVHLQQNGRDSIFQVRVPYRVARR
ncbi:hypothetical protein [Hymenobacter convexus]|uniref:hypothetical protein n=1 Tax=Hymenobacter sp. CA1UV-4 TaxID=3063782 RepID=UPI002713AA77|nr:hypothetical protein [Hymenobacter sp. CA1UV-4]MDO7852641.1 hypothetical protein [Hymenobacter sp. CA1UV-4]